MQSGFGVLHKARRGSPAEWGVGLKRVQMRVDSAAGQSHPTASDTPYEKGDVLLVFGMSLFACVMVCLRAKR